MNDTFDVSAVLVAQKLRRRTGCGKEPEWRIRLTKRIENLKRQINKLTEAKQ